LYFTDIDKDVAVSMIFAVLYDQSYFFLLPLLIGDSMAVQTSQRMACATLRGNVRTGC
jgi:hypothetical protein